MSNITKWEQGAWYTHDCYPNARIQVVDVSADGSLATAAVHYTDRTRWVSMGLDAWDMTRSVREEWGSCDVCDSPYVLGSDDHDGETGICHDCSASR